MTFGELLPELLKLDREEMMRAIEILQREVTGNPKEAQSAAQVEIWSPTITLETAGILRQLLDEDRKKNG